MSEGNEISMITGWIKARLNANAALEAIDPGLSQRVHEDFAPVGERYPFIIVQCQIPPEDVRGVGVTRVMVDTLYIVKVVAQTSSDDALRPIANQIDQTLTTDTTTVVAGGEIYASIRERAFRLTEVDQGKQYRHLGGEYTILARAN